VVDKSLILRRLADLETYLGQIEEYRNVTVNDYSRDWRTQRIVERTIQIMIETCVDIAGHIISDKNYRVPDSYADTFRVLHEAGILAQDLQDALVKMVQFRNIVVHDYNKIDGEIVVGILKKNLGDFGRYKDSIVRFLRTDNVDG